MAPATLATIVDVFLASCAAPTPACAYVNLVESIEHPNNALGRQKHQALTRGLLAAHSCVCNDISRSADDWKSAPIAAWTAGGRAADKTRSCPSSPEMRSTCQSSSRAYWRIELQRGHNAAPEQRPGGSCLPPALLHDPLRGMLCRRFEMPIDDARSDRMPTATGGSRRAALAAAAGPLSQRSCFLAADSTVPAPALPP